MLIFAVIAGFSTIGTAYFKLLEGAFSGWRDSDKVIKPDISKHVLHRLLYKPWWTMFFFYLKSL